LLLLILTTCSACVYQHKTPGSNSQLRLYSGQTSLADVLRKRDSNNCIIKGSTPTHTHTHTHSLVCKCCRCKINTCSAHGKSQLLTRRLMPHQALLARWCDWRDACRFHTCATSPSGRGRCWATGLHGYICNGARTKLWAGVAAYPTWPRHHAEKIAWHWACANCL